MPHLSNPNASASSGNYTTIATNNLGHPWTTVTGTLSAGITGEANSATTISTGSTGRISFTGSTTQTKRVMPAAWTTHKLRGNDVRAEGEAVHESPLNGGHAWFSSLNIASGNARHHWSIFKKMHPEVEYILCGVAETDCNSSSAISNAVFMRESDHQIFESWLDEYLGHFDNDRSALYSFRLPPPPTRMQASIQVTMRHHSDMADLTMWLLKNCQANVYCLQDVLFFLSEDDATLYKMMFTK